MKTIQLFHNDREAVFLRRPNRFLIIAGHNNEEIPCHCPNPGRLIEFFGFRGNDIPGAELILERRQREGGAANPSRAKTAWTAVGLRYRDSIVPLFSARANRAAEELILPRIIGGPVEIHAEFTLGDSRFDFLCIDRQGTRHLVEVKACSLVEEGVAMFPDAPSERALKHLAELAALTKKGYRCHVLFVIVHGKPRRFVPNLHTDPAFAAALSDYGAPADPFFPAGGRTAAGTTRTEGKVIIHAALLRCDQEGRCRPAAVPVPVDLSHGKLAAADGGNYLVIMELPEPRQTKVGALGIMTFRAGWYVYAGSARKNLSKRINRHLRKTGKRQHWHIDYLVPLAGKIRALPVRSCRNLECELAAALAGLKGEPVPRFGASDCRTPGCGSHLYFFPDPPLENRRFIGMLLRFRHRDALESGDTP
ncbi:MAG: DNA/RNA nuclease SfsA [Treponema sp.]|jgi:sugar fermentation stimulation protein A|nr:DNA/RNA nuclease SfsA [Treponema sp.]